VLFFPALKDGVNDTRNISLAPYFSAGTMRERHTDLRGFSPFGTAPSGHSPSIQFQNARNVAAKYQRLLGARYAQLIENRFLRLEDIFAPAAWKCG